MEDLESEIKNQKDKNTKGLQNQSKETNSLRKEREKLTKKNKELTEEIQRLNQKISSLEHQILNQPPPQNNGGYQGYYMGQRRNSRRQSANRSQNRNSGYDPNVIYEKIKKQEEENLPEIKSGDKILSDLVHFCMVKKIDIKQHLRSYDTSKNGRVNEEEFMNAIKALQTRFTDNEIRELIKVSKPKDGGDIIIDEFVELLKSKDYNYKVKEDIMISSDNKQASKKYDYFENKPYNVNYP